ncbi:tachylectin-related carbohydrate-binding protein [Actinosynnema sp. NPDC059797]
MRTTGALVAFTVAASTLVPTGPATAADEVLRCRTAVSVFAAAPDGTLRLYQHDEPELGEHLRAGSSVIGGGWTVPMAVGQDGYVYQVLDGGNLHRFRWTGSDWERPGGGWSVKIAEDWDDWTSVASRKRVAVDSNGAFFKFNSNGELTWERYDGTAWTRRVLETGAANRYDLVVAAGDGVFYVRDPHVLNGVFYRYEYHAASQRFLKPKQLVAHSGDANLLDSAFSAGGDVLYGVSGAWLWWYRYDPATGGFAPRRLVDTGITPGTQYGAMTDACELLGRAVPARPAVPVREDQPNTAVVTTDGLVDYFYVNAAGNLTSAKQRYPGDFSLLTYQAFDGTPPRTGVPGAGLRADGRVEVLVNSPDDAVLRGKRQEVRNGVWGAGTTVHDGWFVGDPVVVADPTGALAVFGVDAQGALWRRPQAAPNGEFLPWQRIGAGATADFTAVRNGSAVDVVTRSADGSARVARYANGALGAWRTIGGGSDVVGKPAVVAHADGTLQVAVRRADGGVHAQREAAGAFPGTWQRVGDVVADGSPALALGTDGLVHVAVRVDDQVHQASQLAPAGAFGPWTTVLFEETVTDPNGYTLADGGPAFSWRTPGGLVATVYTTSSAARSASAAITAFTGVVGKG